MSALQWPSHPVMFTAKASHQNGYFKKSSHSSGCILLVNLITSYFLLLVVFSNKMIVIILDRERERHAIMRQCLHGIGSGEWEGVGGEAQKPDFFLRGAARKKVEQVALVS